MSTKTNVTFTCDLCGHSGQSNDERTPPPGWLHMCFDHPIAEREWVDKHLCGECITRVRQESDKANQPYAPGHTDRRSAIENILTGNIAEFALRGYKAYQTVVENKLGKGAERDWSALTELNQQAWMAATREIVWLQRAHEASLLIPRAKLTP